MQFRIAEIQDIDRIRTIRNVVRENKLANPDQIPSELIEAYLIQRGRGWVCLIKDHIVGFSIVDLVDHNVWALFVHPDFEGQGVGKQLHDIMLDWYFEQTDQTIWLGTEPGTRAERFYQKAGWVNLGMHNAYETKFEMSLQQWLKK